MKNEKNKVNTFKEMFKNLIYGSLAAVYSTKRKFCNYQRSKVFIFPDGLILAGIYIVLISVIVILVLNSFD